MSRPRANNGTLLIQNEIGPLKPGMYFIFLPCLRLPGRVVQSVGHLTRKSRVLGSIPGLATYFRFRFFKNGSYQLLAKVCARNTG